MCNRYDAIAATEECNIFAILMFFFLNESLVGYGRNCRQIQAPDATMTRSTKQLIQPAALDLKKLNRKFENVHPRDILKWCVVNFPTGLVQVSAFNVDDMLVTDLLYRELQSTQRVPVVFIDTLHHFSQTLELAAQAKQLYHLDLKVYRIKGIKTRETFATKHGKALWASDYELFSQLTRIEPLQRGLQELGAIAWITGNRRDQSPTDANLPIFALDDQQRLQVNPLANWSRKETWAYVFEHDVIYHPLHDEGYPMIGDEPVTTAWNPSENDQ